MPANDIAFGTSGLRGPAHGFTPAQVGAYVHAFLDICCSADPVGAVLIGYDLRDSSPAIAETVARCAIAAGRTVIHGGTIPTPALAAYALARGLPAIMVTGSHTPPDYNGLKFYRPDGELLKSDEAPIRATAAAQPDRALDNDHTALPPVTPAVATGYRDRYLSALPGDALKGLSLGILQHSAVGRDLLTEILEGLGARCIGFARASAFVAVDTEAVERDLIAAARGAISVHGLDAVVSTDGDGDRPLLIDETGQQITGDILGAITARHLGATTVVTPLTSTTALERAGWFKNVVRTRIGSPYVVEALRAATADGVATGFEANGGFLLETPALGFAPLPTRDAVLPLIACLADARRRDVALSRLGEELPERVMKAGRLREIAPARGQAFLDRMERDATARAAIAASLEAPVSADLTDGVRFTLDDGAIVHFRQSGNAPELRCYVETGAVADTDALLDVLLPGIDAYLKTLDAK